MNTLLYNKESFNNEDTLDSEDSEDTADSYDTNVGKVGALPRIKSVFVVTANSLNLRKALGIDAPIIKVLKRGALVEFIREGEVQGWWRVCPGGAQLEGYVAKQYLAPASGGGVPDLPGVNEILWRATQTALGRVRYQLGAKHSESGAIDCSGWVAEITRQAFNAVNRAAAPDVVFHSADHRAFDTHSDGIVSGIERRTGKILHGPDIKQASLREGMLIAINFGNYSWELNNPPRVYGIDHIVQVVRNPADDQLFISQSSSSGGGVNVVRLTNWLDQLKSLVVSGRVHAVDPFGLADPNTDYIRNLGVVSIAPKEVSTAVVRSEPRLAPFSGRGFYVYAADDVIRTFGSIASSVTELRRCKIDHIWVRIHGRGYIGDTKNSDRVALKGLVAAAQSAGLRVAGWGWCQGDDPAGEAALALQALGTFGLDAYIADIEQDVNGAKWTAAEVKAFLSTLRAGYAGPLCITSHGFIDWHSPEIFDGAAEVGVDCVNPQAYWFDTFPNQKMLQAVHAGPTKYSLANPASYVQLCFDRWSRYQLPIVATGQACPEGDLDAPGVEQKLSRFLSSFKPPANLLGLNFWHWGATTKGMRDLLAKH
jgi:hypothetical protein